MTKYKKTMGSILSKHENSFYILRDRELFNVNEVGARIFDLCNGANTNIDITGKLSGYYTISNEEILAETNQYLEDLAELGLIKIVS